jgi:hypothetical protein
MFHLKEIVNNFISRNFFTVRNDWSECCGKIVVSFEDDPNSTTCEVILSKDCCDVNVVFKGMLETIRVVEYFDTDDFSKIYDTLVYNLKVYRRFRLDNARIL